MPTSTTHTTPPRHPVNNPSTFSTRTSDAMSRRQTSSQTPLRPAPVEANLSTSCTNGVERPKAFGQCPDSNQPSALDRQKQSLPPTESYRSRQLDPSSRITKPSPQSKASKVKRIGWSRSHVQEYEGYGSDNGDDPTCRPGATPIFACHFYKSQPAQHIKCMTLRLTRIRDIRQHIQRQHTRLYCPTCHETFSSRSQRDDHIYVRVCTPCAPSTMDKLDVALQKLADHRADRGLSTREQWYEIWSRLFPDATRPGSPYLGSMLEETIYLIRDHWTQERSRLLPAFQSQNKLANDENFGELLVHVFKDFHTQEEHGTPDSSREPSPVNEPDGHGTALPGLSNSLPSTTVPSTAPPLLLGNMSSMDCSLYFTQPNASPQWTLPWDLAANVGYISPNFQDLLPGNGQASLASTLDFNRLTQLYQDAPNPGIPDSQFILDVYQSEAVQLLAPQYSQNIELSDNYNRNI
ncbi:hypothetical protein B0J13DRAFT_153049 [Dactylonectria estremocensis]|uniref:C2H2-type domain-containing protein n=1 Tax=Dactylonectria estremocensis TaxID=1079267 RepID=A0A9P9DQU9_9HYPO|nr:hypothetical protein B0J13DRAFT_153049 [Dactylonectria estremocensis]